MEERELRNQVYDMKQLIKRVLVQDELTRRAVERGDLSKAALLPERLLADLSTAIGIQSSVLMASQQESR